MSFARLHASSVAKLIELGARAGALRRDLVRAQLSAQQASERAQGVSFVRYPGFDQDEDGIWTVPGGGAAVAWFRDPDGNLLSLTSF